MGPARRLSRAELARLDLLASERCGLPSAVLMENAGRGAADEVLGLLAGRGRALLLAGPGNNGGDAYVVARHLANAGVEVRVFATVPLAHLRGDAAIMRRALESLGIAVEDAGAEDVRAELERCAVVVDGLLGTGFRGGMRAPIAGLVDLVNAARERNPLAVVALDLPSGLDADSGVPARPTIRADVTVTFAAWKIGFDAPEAQPWLGHVVLKSIGVPTDLLDRR
jgi:NAD(P)H-hydrate epimerase